MDLDPEVSKGYSNLAIAYTRMFEKSRKSGDAKEALAMFEMALDVEPESVSLHTNYGILLAQVHTLARPPCSGTCDAPGTSGTSSCLNRACDRASCR